METDKSVLIIDDDFSLQQTLAQIFEREGFKALTAPIKLSTLELVGANSFALVVMDLNVYNDYGLSLFFKLKYRFPELPIITLSSSHAQDPDTMAVTEKSWVNLIKPVSPKIIVETALNLIGAHVGFAIS